MISTSKLAALALMLPALAYGATINYSAQNSERNYLALADGVTFVPDGTLVRLGYFDSEIALTNLSSRNDLTRQDVAGLEPFFRELDNTRTPGALLRPGSFADVANVVDPDGATGGPNIVGRQLWILAYFAQGQTSSVTVQEAISNVQQFGAFALDAANWKIPSDDPVPASSTIDLGQLNGTATGTAGRIADLLPTARIPVGRYTSASELNAQGARSFALETVPEPTSIVMLSVGLVAAFGRRNRRK